MRSALIGLAVALALAGCASTAPTASLSQGIPAAARDDDLGGQIDGRRIEVAHLLAACRHLPVARALRFPLIIDAPSYGDLLQRYGHAGALRLVTASLHREERLLLRCTSPTGTTT